MNEENQTGFVLPTRMARRRLLVGRIVLSVVCANVILALVTAYLLSGPFAGFTRFSLGFWGWAAVVFPASLLLAVPLVGLLVLRLLRPPIEGENP